MKKQVSKKSENKSKRMYGLALAMILGGATLSVPMHVEAAEKFDPAFYAAAYADVVNALGTESKALYDHYLTYGQKEGRKAYPGAKGGETVEGIADTKAQVQETPAETSVNGLAALEQLPHLKSLKKNIYKNHKAVCHFNACFLRSI